MNDRNTVFALSTPVGGAIAIMRITGPAAKPAAEALFTGRLEHRRVSYGRICDADGSTVDTCCAAYFRAPSSYTGEDMVEISFHGSPAVAAKLSGLIANTGLAVPAEPGEFTKRAYLNGKMDLARAEAVMYLIASSAEGQRRAAARQLEGRLSGEIASLYERTKLALARLANAMDDDTGEVELDEAALISEIAPIKSEIRALAEGGMRSRILREGARVAIIGSPNAGKSSLLNALLLKERAIVTEIPGTTRDTLEESAAIDGLPVVFVDTAGIRSTFDSVELMGIERSRRAAEDADLILWLVDGSRPFSSEDEAIRAFINVERAVAVITKSDLENVIFPNENGEFYGLEAVRISAVSSDGLDALKKLVSERLLPCEGSEAEGLVTNVRHIGALEDALAALEAAENRLGDSDTDAAFYELNAAMEHLAAILGRENPAEELVDSIFAHFCMGK